MPRFRIDTVHNILNGVLSITLILNGGVFYIQYPVLLCTRGTVYIEDLIAEMILLVTPIIVRAEFE